jgi:hypothetical protein
MSSNPPPDTTELMRKLLAIKRYEQPPPGFFRGFPDKVVARIQAASMAGESPWWRQWLIEWTGRPLLTSAYGLLFAGLVVVAVGLAQTPVSNDLHSPVTGAALLPPPGASYHARQSLGLAARPAMEASNSSVSPVFDAEAALWSASAPHAGIERVSFRTR